MMYVTFEHSLLGGKTDKTLWAQIDIINTLSMPMVKNFSKLWIIDIPFIFSYYLKTKKKKAVVIRRSYLRL